MARIRTIKPEFNTSKSVARLSDSAALFMLKLLPEADDHGRMEWMPRAILGALYPHSDTVEVKDIKAYADELVAEDIVRFYTVGEDVFLFFVNWQEHQKIDRPSRSKCPDPPAPKTGRSSNVSRNPREPLAQNSPPEREVGKGKGIR